MNCRNCYLGEIPPNIIEVEFFYHTSPDTSKTELVLNLRDRIDISKLTDLDNLIDDIDNFVEDQIKTIIKFREELDKYFTNVEFNIEENLSLTEAFNKLKKIKD